MKRCRCATRSAVDNVLGMDGIEVLGIDGIDDAVAAAGGTTGVVPDSIPTGVKPVVPAVAAALRWNWARAILVCILRS